MQKENPRSSLPRSARSLAGQPSFLHLPELLAFGVHVTCMCAQKVSCVRLFGTPCTVAHQAPLSMELPRQEYWSGLPFLTPLYVISKVFSCVLQENQGELCILHLVWNWNADGFWNHHMRELPCCFQLCVGIKCENLIRRLQCWIKSGGTPPALSHYQTQGILEANLAHMLPRRLGCHHQALGWGLLCCELVCLTWPIILDSHQASLFESPRLTSLPVCPAPGLVPCVYLTVYSSVCPWFEERFWSPCHRGHFIYF